MKLLLRIMAAFMITGVGLWLVLNHIPPSGSYKEAVESIMDKPVGISYRGQFTEYDIVVGRTEINIVEFVNKRGEHCMLAVRNEEIQMICENH